MKPFKCPAPFTQQPCGGDTIFVLTLYRKKLIHRKMNRAGTRWSLDLNPCSLCPELAFLIPLLNYLMAFLHELYNYPSSTLTPD